MVVWRVLYVSVCVCVEGLFYRMAVSGREDEIVLVGGFVLDSVCWLALC